MEECVHSCCLDSKILTCSNDFFFLNKWVLGGEEDLLGLDLDVLVL